MTRGLLLLLTLLTIRGDELSAGVSYFSSDVDFAGHYVAIYGYDDNDVFVVDTAQQGGEQSTSRAVITEMQ